MRWGFSATVVMVSAACAGWSQPSRAEAGASPASPERGQSQDGSSPGSPGRGQDQDQVEPSYGRVEGDLSFVFGAGAVAAPRGGRGEVELRVRYLESAGIFATYEDGLIFGSAAEPGRVLAAGLELRPLFLYRWLQGHETEKAAVDLLIDSFGIELGATLSQPSGQGLTQSGVQFGIGVELPILLRAYRTVGRPAWRGVRWSDVALASGEVQGADDRSVYIAVTLSWHQAVLTHLVDLGDEPRR